MKKTNIKIAIIVMLLVVFSLSATYAYLELSAFDNNTATGEGGCFEVNYSGQEITNTSLISDIELNVNDSENPVPSTTVTLSKDDECKIYTEVDIKLHTNNDAAMTAPVDEVHALKYKIERISGNGEILVSNGSTSTTKEGVITEKGDTTLATVSLTDTTTTYKIYLWLDANISIGAYDGTNYSGYIFAESLQSSDITQ